ncbi:hypothetical protein K438DRAFT_2015278 [Mycena galopus ATCC 62051]|nr:hypothetical protein K438DRAFT_2015278 [Mycena galopus ATCC 62051]
MAPTSISKKPPRTLVACYHCRKRKMKCITTEQPPKNPCKNCTVKRLPCEYVAVDAEDGLESTSRSFGADHSMPPPSSFRGSPSGTSGLSPANWTPVDPEVLRRSLEYPSVPVTPHAPYLISRDSNSHSEELHWSLQPPSAAAKSHPYLNPQVSPSQSETLHSGFHDPSATAIPHAYFNPGDVNSGFSEPHRFHAFPQTDGTYLIPGAAPSLETQAFGLPMDSPQNLATDFEAHPSHFHPPSNNFGQWADYPREQAN